MPRMIRPKIAMILIEVKQNSDSPYTLTAKILRRTTVMSIMVIHATTGLEPCSCQYAISVSIAANTYTGLFQ